MYWISNSRLETLDENINELEVRHQKLSKLSTKSKKSEKKNKQSSSDLWKNIKNSNMCD